MKVNNIAISLTSIPRRLEHSIWEVLTALKQQSIQCPIILNVPKTYRKWGEYEPSQKLKDDKDIILWRPAQDYGPATKLLGGLEYARQHPEIEYIITFDDDMYYQNQDVVKYFLSISLHYPKFALATRGIKLEHYPYRTANGLNHNFSGFVDAPRGFAGVMYPVKPLLENDVIFNLYKELPTGIFHEDDAYFGMVLGILGIPLLSTPLLKGLVSCKDRGESAVEEHAEKDRIDNEMELYQYAVEKGYLPNKSSLVNKNGTHTFDVIEHQKRSSAHVSSIINAAQYFYHVRKDKETAVVLMQQMKKFLPYETQLDIILSKWDANG